MPDERGRRVAGVGRARRRDCASESVMTLVCLQIVHNSVCAAVRPASRQTAPPPALTRLPRRGTGTRSQASSLTWIARPKILINILQVMIFPEEHAQERPSGRHRLRRRRLRRRRCSTRTSSLFEGRHMACCSYTYLNIFCGFSSNRIRCSNPSVAKKVHF